MIGIRRGIVFALAATALFAITSAIVKVLVADYPVLQILFVRQLIVGVSVLPSILKSDSGQLKTDYPGLHGLRLMGAFVALTAGIWSVAILPLTSATVLAFTQVFFVVLLAARFLNETISKRRVLTIVAGFVGVTLVVRPGLDGMTALGVLIAIGGALGAAVAVTCVRTLSQTDSTATLLTYQALFVGLMSGIPMFWIWKSPTLWDLVMLITIGVLATAAQWFGVAALRLSPVSVIGNIEYMKLFYASVLGYLFFSEIPAPITLIGSVIIVLSAISTIREVAHA